MSWGELGGEHPLTCWSGSPDLITNPLTVKLMHAEFFQNVLPLLLPLQISGAMLSCVSISLSHFCFQFLDHEPFLSGLYAQCLDLLRRRWSGQIELKKLEEGFLRSTTIARLSARIGTVHPFALLGLYRTSLRVRQGLNRPSFCSE